MECSSFRLFKAERSIFIQIKLKINIDNRKNSFSKMSYYDRSSRRYMHPFDMMEDALSRFNEAFRALSDPMMMPRYLDRPYYDRQTLERERSPEKRRKIQESETKGSEKQALEKAKSAAPETSEMKSLLERPIDDVLRVFDEPFFKSHWETEPTFDRAQKLLDEMTAKGKPNIHISPDDELLKAPENLGDAYQKLGEKSGAKLSGTSYQTSTITKDGKTVTVVRQSKLLPDGRISTKVSQHFQDESGHRDTISRKKVINCKTGAIVEDLQKPKKIKDEGEAQKIHEKEKKEESSK